jgi:hypothetical protein
MGALRLGDPEEGQFYRHYKGDLYRAYGVAKHTEEPHYFAVYENVHRVKYIRPVAMFKGQVVDPVHSDVVEGQTLYTVARFRRLRGWEKLVAWLSFLLHSDLDPKREIRRARVRRKQAHFL